MASRYWARREDYGISIKLDVFDMSAPISLVRISQFGYYIYQTWINSFDLLHKPNMRDRPDCIWLLPQQRMRSRDQCRHSVSSSGSKLIMEISRTTGIDLNCKLMRKISRTIDIDLNCKLMMQYRLVHTPLTVTKR